MSTETESYERLPGRSFGAGTSSTLWLARDHLLVVTSVPGGESYRRYFLRDIQAIVIRGTRRRLYLNLLFGVVALFNLLPLLHLLAAETLNRWGALQALGTLVWLGLIAANSLRGPTCETRFKTAVQYQPVPVLGRRDRTREIMAILRPRINAAQTPPAKAGPGDGGGA
jgi:hypothetical protein